MTQDTAAALQALIKQVETLSTSVADQAKRLDDVHSFNTRILDEKKDVQRKLEAQQHAKKSIVDIVNEQEYERKMRAANLEKDANGNWNLKGHRPKHAFSRTDARDPVKYRSAKTAAKKDGATLTVIDESDGDPTIRNTGQSAVIQSKTFTFDDTHTMTRWVRADMQTGGGLVQRRMQAEKEGFTIKTFRTPYDLPQHARTKFELMERAASAESGKG